MNSWKLGRIGWSIIVAVILVHERHVGRSRIIHVL